MALRLRAQILTITLQLRLPCSSCVATLNVNDSFYDSREAVVFLKRALGHLSSTVLVLVSLVLVCSM